MKCEEWSGDYEVWRVNSFKPARVTRSSLQAFFRRVSESCQNHFREVLCADLKHKVVLAGALRKLCRTKQCWEVL